MNIKESRDAENDISGVVPIETSCDGRWITGAAPKTGVITRRASICTRAMRAA